MKKDLKKIAEALREQGFETILTKRGHLQVFRNGRYVATFAGTASDWRSLKNSLADARRAGFEWPPKG